MVNMDNKNRIMKVPDKIFCWRGVLGTLFCSLKKGTNIDCTEYIHKGALLELAKKELENAKITDFDEFGRGEVITWERIIDKLNSM